jgi:hypothetical protein
MHWKYLQCTGNIYNALEIFTELKIFPRELKIFTKSENISLAFL